MSEGVQGFDEKKQSKIQVTASDLQPPRNKRALDVKDHENADRLDAILAALNAPPVAAIEPIYSFDPSVPTITPTEILSYTVPSGVIASLLSASVSGNNRGRWTVKVDGVVIEAKRAWWTNSFNEEFNLEGLKLSSGQVVSIEVENQGDTSTKFETTLKIGKYT